MESPISKYIRPGIIIWSFALLTVFAVCDGNFKDFEIKVVYVQIIETITVTSALAYIASKGFERTTAIKTPPHPDPKENNAT